MRLPKGTKRLLSYLLFVFGLQWEKVCVLSENICEGKHMIKCKNKDCVPASFKCDGEDDCGDNSDESDCKTNTPKVQCGPEDFVCANEKCIVHSYACDGEDDCGDNSDEKNCTKTDRHVVKCNNSTNFQCKNGRCLPHLYTCDTVDDCGDNSDESKIDGPKCSDQSTCPSENMFRCANSGFCISKLRICDGNNDCSIGDTTDDKSDEHNCSAYPCMPGQMKCGNGICLSKIWKCNGIDDCGDMSDEKNCTSLCGKDEYKCRSSSVCISSDLHCNGVKNCQDGSDEEMCPHILPTPEIKPCTSNQYQCPSNKRCIMKGWLCDGNPDCAEKEDESSVVCSKHKCKNDESQCTNGQCIPKRYKCDGVADCYDESDEKNCNITRVFKCSKQTYRCRNSTKCIHPLQFCDGITHCPEGEDEGSKCGVNECLVKAGNCSHGCKDLRIGHICTCPKGYKLSFDNVTCVDINECKEFGSCTQACVNYEGSYACLCDKGFTLDVGDKKTCRALAPKPYLLFANDFDIREVSLSGDDYKSILSIWSSIIALAVDTRDQMVYWACNYNKTISRAPIGNPLKVDVILKTDVKLLRGLDVDWIGRKLYWTDAVLKTINVADLNGANRKILARGGPREEFRGIAVHPEKGYIFWTNWVQSHSKIERANLDGSDRRTIVSTGIVWVSGLAIDYQLNRVYWSDRYHRHISSSTIHGTDVRKIVTNLHKPTGLAIFEDKVYWLDSDEKKLSRANKFNGRKRIDYKENLISPIDLVIYHPSAQKKVAHPCENNNGGCSHLCFMAPETQRSMCGCPDNLYLGADGRTCSMFRQVATANKLNVVTFKCVGANCVETGKGVISPVHSKSAHRREFMIAYIIGGVLAMLCIVTIIVVVVVVVYKKKRNQFGLSILYETDTDLVRSNSDEKDEKDNTTDTEGTRRYLPDITTRCKKAVLSFDNINFKPFKDDTDILNNPTPDVDLVMDECPVDDDRKPIIAHMV